MKPPDPTRETHDALLDELADLRSANELLHGLITNRDTEIERLRNALETIADIFPENHTAAAIARRALEGK